MTWILEEGQAGIGVEEWVGVYVTEIQSLRVKVNNECSECA